MEHATEAHDPRHTRNPIGEPPPQPRRAPPRRPGRRASVRVVAIAALAVAATAALLTACGSGEVSASNGDRGSTASAYDDTVPPDDHSMDDHSMGDATMDPADRAAAQLATAGFQDVETAEAAGYASTLDTLGCFQNAEKGGMGLHYLNQSRMDATVDITAPEALVYELDNHGAITGLVAHEYIVPIDAWTSPEPPSLFGVDFHRHPTLPLWVLHTWIWKDNPTGVFQDWNPAVRQCPAGVPIFGVDRP